MVFAKRFKELREKRGWTQEDIAKRLKISRNTVAGYESKGKIPREDTLIAIANLFDTTTDYLLGRTDDPNPQPSADDKIQSALRKINEAIDPSLDSKYIDVFLNTLEKIFYMAKQPDFPKEQEEAFKTVLEIVRTMMIDGQKIPEPILEILAFSLETAKREMQAEKEKTKKPPQSEGELLN